MGLERKGMWFAFQMAQFVIGLIYTGEFIRAVINYLKVYHNMVYMCIIRYLILTANTDDTTTSAICSC